MYSKMDGLFWQDLQLFLAVQECGSLSAAARRLGLSQPTLSRRMNEMELNMGEALFERRAQGVVLTIAGERLLPAVRQMAEWAETARQHLHEATSSLSGRVRIAAAPRIAREFLAPLAADILHHYPELQLEVTSGVEVRNLARGEADLAIRTIVPQDDDLIILDRIEGPVSLVASPDYVASLPKKASLQDLRWISWSSSHEEQLSHQALTRLLGNFRPVFTSDDYNVQCAACVAGVGIMPMFVVPHRFAKNSGLVNLPFDLGPEAVAGVYLVCHRRQRDVPRLRAVIKIIRAEFELARMVPRQIDSNTNFTSLETHLPGPKKLL